jgi:hypothetical protein
MKNKVKKLTEFNGQLIMKLNYLINKLSDQEIIFYNRLIHHNLNVLDKLSNTSIEKEKKEKPDL